jgi:hypothetical protein
MARNKHREPSPIRCQAADPSVRDMTDAYVFDAYGTVWTSILRFVVTLLRSGVSPGVVERSLWARRGPMARRHHPPAFPAPFQ